MPERLVDVMNSFGNVIHTYPVTLLDSGNIPNEARYEAKALEAARFEKLVSVEKLGTLSARMHIARGGPMEPYGDYVPVMAQTRTALVQAVREQAYSIWKQHDGDHRSATEDWLQARQQLLEKRAYTLWEEDGRPDSRADDYWFRALQFEPC
jgi:hypothetical protein